MTIPKRLRAIPVIALAIALLALIPAPAKIYSADSVTVTSSAELQAAIDSAPSGSEQVIILGSDITVDETITIPEGKNITIKDDSTARTIARSVPLFDCSGKLTLAPTSNDNLIVTGDGSEWNKGSIVTVTGENAVLEMKGGTYNVGTLNQTIAGGILIDEGAVFNMHGGIIKDALVARQAAQVFVIDSAVLIGQVKGTFNMYGGEITGCSTTSPGYSRPINPTVSACYVSRYNYAEAVINMYGGRIHHNEGGASSAVFVGGSTQQFNMYGGIIEDNDSTKAYGSTDTYGQSGALGNTIRVIDEAGFTLDGGTIRNNKARSGGGAFLLGAGSMNLKSGLIEGNTVEYFGGGLFINPYIDDESPRYVTMDSTAIYGNTAFVQGGGIYSCPTGATVFHATDGIAVFDNTAYSEKYNNAGDDYSNVGSAKQTMSISMSSRMLGGGLVTYYTDGAVRDTGSSTGGVDTSVPRFDPNNPGEPVNPTGLTNSYALKVIASDEAKASAKDAAKLTIRNNTGRRGGGVALNINLRSGTDSDSWKVLVEKKWEDTEASDKTPIKVNLVRKDFVLGTATLGPENGWKAEFSDLPDPSTLEDAFTVVENVPDGFAVYYDKKTEGKTITYTLTNRKKNPEPEIIKTVNGSDNLKLKKLDDDFTYQIETRIPDDASSFSIEDNMDKALEFVEPEKTEVAISEVKLSEAELRSQVIQDNNKLTVKFTKKQIEEQAGRPVTITFKAKLAENVDFSKYKDNKIPNIAYYLVDGKVVKRTEGSGATVEPPSNSKSPAPDEDADKSDKDKTKGTPYTINTGDSARLLPWFGVLVIAIYLTVMLRRRRD